MPWSDDRLREVFQMADKNKKSWTCGDCQQTIEEDNNGMEWGHDASCSHANDD